MVPVSPHTSLHLQPRYLKFEGILKAALNRECDLCVRRSAQEEITHYELGQFFSKTKLKVIKMEKKEYRASEMQTFA